jgi:hypothetical protein
VPDVLKIAVCTDRRGTDDERTDERHRSDRRCTGPVRRRVPSAAAEQCSRWGHGGHPNVSLRVSCQRGRRGHRPGLPRSDRRSPPVGPVGIFRRNGMQCEILATGPEEVLRRKEGRASGKLEGGIPCGDSFDP